MKASTLAVGIVLVMAVFLEDVSAKRNRGNKNNGCSEWTYEECVPKQGSCGRGKKQGTRTGDNCAVTEKRFRCMVACPEEEEDGAPGCSMRKYSKGEKGECDVSTNLQQVTFTLKDPASNTDCSATLVKSLECRRVTENGQKMKKACKFTKGEWSDCDAATGLRTRVDTLKKSRKRADDDEGEECAETRTLNNPCAFRERKLKRLRKNNRCSEWTFSECVPEEGACGKGTKMGTRTGDQCQKTEKEFRCKIPCGSGDKCRPKMYTKGTWGECDATTELKTMTLTLKDGVDSTTCPATKEKSKKCRPVAQDTCPVRFYEKSAWSECDPTTFLKTMTFTLKEGSNALCPATKVKSKKCKLLDASGKKMKPACKFSKGEWGECDEATGLRTRVDSLQRAKGDHFCADTRTMSKPCGK